MVCIESGLADNICIRIWRVVTKAAILKIHNIWFAGLIKNHAWE
jgi:hypothetical protein